MTIEGFREYQIKLVEIVKPLILSSIKTERVEFREIIRNILFDEDGPRNFSSTFNHRDEVFAKRLVLEFDEIVDFYLSLRNIEVYIRRFPYCNTGISSLSYLKYHITSYFNEIYIFKNRFEAHLTFLEKRYRKSHIGQAVKERTQSLKELISDSLSKIVDTRGSHVHSQSYSDQDLERLFLLQILSTDEAKGEVFLKAYRFELQRYKKKWSNQIISTNDTIEQLFDMCCQKLYSVLFTGNGQFIFPDDR